MARYNFLKEISQNGKWETRKMEKHRHLHMRGGLRRIPVVYAELKSVSVAEIDLREHETEKQQQPASWNGGLPQNGAIVYEAIYNK